jgi:hypothetical protein
MLSIFSNLILTVFRGAGTADPSTPPPEGDLWQDNSEADWEDGTTLIWES